MNRDHVIANQVQQDIAHQLTKRKIYMAPIQATHIPRNLNYEQRIPINNNISYAHTENTPEHDLTGKYIVGVDVSIRRELSPHISAIDRINSRILKVALCRKESHTPITPIATYVPHQCYKNHDKSAHWGEVGKPYQKHPDAT